MKHNCGNNSKIDHILHLCRKIFSILGKKATKNAYEDYKNNLEDKEFYVSHEYIQFISDYYNINIYVIHDKTRDVYNLEKGFYKERPGIILLWLEDVPHYETIHLKNEDEMKYIFEIDDEIVQKIMKKLS
jgi:hypothetical protein